jgi:hypothetical protein
MSIDAVLAMVSHLECEIRVRNPVAAYFLLMCRLSLLEEASSAPGFGTERTPAPPVGVRDHKRH